jgi:hypothetical protein
MKFVVKMEAIIECPNEAAAKKAAEEITKQLAKPYVKVLLSSGGVSLVGSRVDPKPVPER